MLYLHQFNFVGPRKILLAFSRCYETLCVGTMLTSDLIIQLNAKIIHIAGKLYRVL